MIKTHPCCENFHIKMPQRLLLVRGLLLFWETTWRQHLFICTPQNQTFLFCFVFLFQKVKKQETQHKHHKHQKMTAFFQHFQSFKSPESSHPNQTCSLIASTQPNPTIATRKPNPSVRYFPCKILVVFHKDPWILILARFFLEIPVNNII